MNHVLLENHLELSMIRELDGLMNSHINWLNQLNRALICGTKPDPLLLAADAHRCCSFGEWYYSFDHIQGEKWSIQLKKLGIPHKQMHDLAKVLLENAAMKPIAAKDYDHFSTVAYRFKATMRAFQFKLIKDVCLVDHLTGAWNRSSLMQRIAGEYDRMVRNGDTCCLCMMDLDFFKAINDSFGHSVGDQVLQGIVNIISRRLRRYDSLFRYGGEEFLYCLPKIALNEAVAAMERVRKDIEETPIVLKNGQSVSAKASFGVVEMVTTRSIEENIEVADHALLRAKAGGRNQVCW